MRRPHPWLVVNRLLREVLACDAWRDPDLRATLRTVLEERARVRREGWFN